MLRGPAEAGRARPPAAVQAGLAGRAAPSGARWFSAVAAKATDRAFAVNAATALLLLAVVLLSHPFTGVRHDGILYAGEALARILPGEFHDDLYFLFGSQGRFTLLPRLYAALITTFGLGTGTMVGLVAAFASYLAGAWYVLQRLVPERMRIACLLGVVLGWSLYGGHRIFGYNEAFLTARSFAEPIVLFAIGALLRRRLAAAFVLLAIATCVHPLIAIGGWLVLAVHLVRRDVRWAFVGAAAAAVVGVCGALGLGPFADLFARYDDTWLDYVQDVNIQAFVLRWTWVDYGIVAFDATILAIVLDVCARERVRGLVRAVLVAGAVSLVASVCLVDLALNPFFGKLQMWRAVWLMQWVAMALLPLALVRLWTRGERGRIVACLLAIGWVAPFTAAPGVLALMSLALHFGARRTVVSATTTRIVVVAAAVAALVVAVQFEARVFKLGAMLDQPLGRIVGQALALNLLLMIVALVGIRWLRRAGRVAPLIALVVVAGAASLWDQRGPWTRRLESYAPGTYLWPGVIEPRAKVYWFRDLMAPWVLLGHGNYYTEQQASGAVFSRDMVIELDRRRKLTAVLDFQEEVCRMMNNLNEKAGACEPDATAVRSLCVDGRIDYVVLQSVVGGAAPAATFATGVVENGYEKKFFLYRCAGLIKG